MPAVAQIVIKIGDVVDRLQRHADVVGAAVRLLEAVAEIRFDQPRRHKGEAQQISPLVPMHLLENLLGRQNAEHPFLLGRLLLADRHQGIEQRLLQRRAIL